MRNKWIMTLLIAIFTLPIFTSAVFADDVVYEDGEYRVVAKALNANTGEPSGAAGFLNEEANVTVNNGEITLTITAPHDPVAEIGGLQIEGIEPSITEDDNTKYFAFKLPSLKENYDARVQYQVPSFNIDHDVALRFAIEGIDQIPVVEEEPNNNDSPSAPDEAYTINYVSDLNIGRNFANPVALLVKDGRQYIQINGSGAQFIDSLTLNGEEVTWGPVNDNGTFTIQFEIGSLSETVNFSMYLTTPIGEMTHHAKVSFDESTKTAANVNDYSLLLTSSKPETPGDDQDTGTDTGSDNDQDTETGTGSDDDQDTETGTGSDDDQDTETGTGSDDDQDTETGTGSDDDDQDTETGTGSDDKQDNDSEKNNKDLDADKLYTIKYTFLHATENDPSAADEFFTNTALIVERDGERFVRLTTTAPQFIDSLTAVFGNERVSLEQVENNGDSAVYEFKLPSDFSYDSVINVEMQITVPGIYTGMVYDTRLVFDADTLKEISTDEIPAPPVKEQNPIDEEDDGKNGGNGKGDGDVKETDDKKEAGSQNGGSKLDPNTPGKPELGDAAKGGDSKGGLNPKTGENTNIILYVLLLVASAVPLAIKLKRRFI